MPPVCIRLRCAGKSFPGCDRAERSLRLRPRRASVRPPCFGGSAKR